jgi:hypothetical protein
LSYLSCILARKGAKNAINKRACVVTVVHFGDTYSFSDITVIGATNLGKDYALYKIDETKASQIGLTESILISVTYKAMRDALTKERLEGASKGEYLDLYLTVYAELLAK